MHTKLIVTIFIISSTYQPVANQKLEIVQQDKNGYSTSIIHPNPRFLDQQAESSADLHFEPSNTNQFNNIEKHVYKTPYPHRSVENQPEIYPLQFAQALNDNKPQEFNVNPIPNRLQNVKSSPSSQSFNVGYSVKFGGAQSPIKQVKQFPTLSNTDIITGSHKEEVIKPQNVNQINEEYVLNSVLDNKKQKISGIKPKYYRPVTSNIDPTKLITQANLSPKTQMKLFELQGNKQPDYENDQYLKNANSSPWKTLGPGVEIYQSSPVQTINKEFVVEPKNFDHAKALGKSIKFDSSNIMGFQPTYVHDTQFNIDVPSIQTNGNSKNLYATKKIQHNFEVKSVPVDNVKSTSIVTSKPLQLIQQHIKFNRNFPYTVQQPNIDLPQQKHNTDPSNEHLEGNYHVPRYLSNSQNVENTPQHFSINLAQQNLDAAQNNKNLEGSFSNGRYTNEAKTLISSQTPSLNPNDKFNTAPTIYSNIREVNTQLENNFKKHMENIYKFTEHNINPTFTAYNQNPNDHYGQYSQQIPMLDLTKNAMVQQYIYQPSKNARATTQMYSVQENQSDDIKPSEIYENKIYSKNYPSSYIPHKNFYGNNYGSTKKIRPSSRYIKDAKKHLKPHSRNKGHVRMGSYL